MDNPAPAPTSAIKKTISADTKEEVSMIDPKNPSAVSVTIVGCGGAGINFARPFLTDKRLQDTIFFDTSETNTRRGESVITFNMNSGSGSNRSENARDIERHIPQLSDEQMGLSDVAIVMFSLGGGSGSVLGPLMMREYNKRGARVIGLAVADSGYSVAAKNTLNTLKTLTQISKNNEIYLPMILLTNDHTDHRNVVNEAATSMVSDLLDLLTKPVYEVDRNDRLNWINPSKNGVALPGVKLMSFISDKDIDPKIIFGGDSTEMVDTMLLLESADGNGVPKSTLPPARLKKTGIYYEKHKAIVGKITSDITAIEKILTHVDRMDHADKSQKHLSVDRLSSTGSDDLIL